MRLSIVPFVLTLVLKLAFTSSLYSANSEKLQNLTSELAIENPKHGFVSASAPTKWEESLICGNGTIGLTMPGHAQNDRIVICHEKLFLPKYRPYPAPDLGSRWSEIQELTLNGNGKAAAEIVQEEVRKAGMKELVWPNPPVPACQLEFETLVAKEVTCHARSTNFENGEMTVAHKTDENIIYRQAFASREDGVAVVKFSSPSEAKLSYKFRLHPLPNNNPKFNPDDYVDYESRATSTELTYVGAFKKQWEGSLKGYTLIAKVIPQGGTVEVKDGWLHVSDAAEILVLMDVKLTKDLPVAGAAELKERLARIPADYEKLLARHAPIHSELFNRFSFGLGEGSTQLDQTSEDLLESSSFESPSQALTTQVVKAGRYALICSTGAFPPTLQGLWSGTWTPSWSGDFTMNGNVQTAIACGLNANLMEATDSYLNLIEGLMPDFEANARDVYGQRGVFVTQRLTDSGSTYHTLGYVPHLFWFSGSTWTAHFYYDKWLYNCDEEYLQSEAIPFMLAAYKFLRGILYEAEDGKYHIVPSYSAENAPKGQHPATVNATQDVAGLKQLTRNLITLVEEGYLPKDNLADYQDVLAKLPEYTVDESGELCEWLWDGVKNNNTHRHAAHLYPLYDGIDPEFEESQELKDAARVAIERRLEFRRPQQGSGMAFGLVHLGMASAHLKDKEHAYECVNWLVNSYWTPAFGCYHDPGAIFNVDITGGVPALVSYMLVQSTPDEIVLLPCLPDAWNDGFANSIPARGGFEIDLKWKGGQLTEATVRSKAGRPCKVRYNGESTQLELQAGESRELKF